MFPFQFCFIFYLLYFCSNLGVRSAGVNLVRVLPAKLRHIDESREPNLRHRKKLRRASISPKTDVDHDEWCCKSNWKAKIKMPSKMEVASPHCSTVANKTTDISEHCKDWKDLLKMIGGRGVRCDCTLYKTDCTNWWWYDDDLIRWSCKMILWDDPTGH